MKKTYEKPRIVFDSFELSQSIAGDCELLKGNSAENACPVYVKGTDYTLFADVGNCYWVPHEPVCYHVPIDTNNVFSS